MLLNALYASVLAAADNSPQRTHRAAADIVDAVFFGGDRAHKVSLWALELGPLGGFEIAERTIRSAVPGQNEVVSALLPAWAVEATSDLRGYPGAGPVIAGLSAMLADPQDVQASVATNAEFNERGFHAGSVAAIGVRLGTSLGRDVVAREATVRFNRPFAVRVLDVSDSLWRGVPCAIGWIGPDQVG